MRKHFIILKPTNIGLLKTKTLSPQENTEHVKKYLKFFAPYQHNHSRGNAVFQAKHAFIAQLRDRKKSEIVYYTTVLKFECTVALKIPEMVNPVKRIDFKILKTGNYSYSPYSTLFFISSFPVTFFFMNHSIGNLPVYPFNLMLP